MHSGQPVSLAVAMILVLCLLFPRVYASNLDPRVGTPEKWAVIVGVSSYQYVSDLKFCDDDAASLCSKLAPTWGADHVKLLVDSAATKSAVSNAVSTWLAPLEDSDDTVLFFFSGHGGQGSDVAPLDEADGQDEYICPYDSLTTSWLNDIRDDELGNWLNGLDASKIVVMLDTCFAGGFIDRMALKSKIAKPAQSDVSPAPNDGFVKDLSKSGRVILAASAEDEESEELTSLGHGLFSYYILEALGNFTITDANLNHEVSAEEVFGHVEPKVLAYAAAKNISQHPAIYDGYAGELPLVTITTTTFAASGGVSLLTVDGANVTCTQSPTSFAWATNTIHAVNVSAQAYEIITNGTLESPHPYTNYCNSNWTVTGTNATQIRIHFSYIQTERNYDRIFVTDSAGNAVANYTGNFTDTWSPWINGSTVRIRLYSDFSKTYDGFKVDCYQVPNERRMFTGWSDGNQSSTRTLIATNSQNLTALYLAEHYLQVNSLYGNATGSGWYTDGISALAALGADSLDFGNGTRCAFAGWSGDAYGQNASASNPIFMNAPKTATATWKIQHQVSFAVSPADSGSINPARNNTWIDVNNTINISAINGNGYIFSSWTSTEAIIIVNASTASTNASVNGPGSITANFVVQVIPETTVLGLLAATVITTAMAIFQRRRKRLAVDRDN
jgi:hypothetical protein